MHALRYMRARIGLYEGAFHTWITLLMSIIIIIDQIRAGNLQWNTWNKPFLGIISVAAIV